MRSSRFLPFIGALLLASTASAWEVRGCLWDGWIEPAGWVSVTVGDGGPFSVTMVTLTDGQIGPVYWPYAPSHLWVKVVGDPVFADVSLYPDVPLPECPVSPCNPQELWDLGTLRLMRGIAPDDTRELAARLPE